VATIAGVEGRSWRPSLPPLGERVIARANRAWDAPYRARFASFVASEARRVDAKLLHAHFGMAAWKVLSLRRRLGLPLVVTFYGVDVSHCLVDPYWRPRIAQVVREADRCIVLCDEARDRLLGLGAAPERVTLWDIGIPLEEYPYREHQAECGARLLTVARFVEKKGHRHLLEAFRIVSDQRPEARLVLIGNGPLRDEIDRRIDALGLAEVVSLIDTTQTVDFFALFKDALADADLFVLPSVVARDGDDEGGPPVVITNAMAAGVPVVATPVGGIGRAVLDGKTGVLCPPERPDELARALVALIDDVDRRREMSVAARKLAEERFDRQRQIGRLDDLYLEAIGEARLPAHG
jgi:colanic acid/amylovoran biosynthesis glycosyltransferase